MERYALLLLCWLRAFGIKEKPPKGCTLRVALFNFATLVILTPSIAFLLIQLSFHKQQQQQHQAMSRRRAGAARDSARAACLPACFFFFFG
jgi:hypothetical protein